MPFAVRALYFALLCSAQWMHAGEAVATAAFQELKQQVTEAERAFAKTMADRDHAAFVTFLADEAVFFAGQTPQRGKQQIAEAWKRFYEKPAAPFSWQPETVEVLDSARSPLFGAGA